MFFYRHCVVCEKHFKLTDTTGTERKRLIATAKQLSAHDVYFEDNTPLEILDDVEINTSNASDLIIIHDVWCCIRVVSSRKKEKREGGRG
jgi:hypothetical protein